MHSWLGVPTLGSIRGCDALIWVRDAFTIVQSVVLWGVTVKLPGKELIQVLLVAIELNDSAREWLHGGTPLAPNGEVRRATVRPLEPLVRLRAQRLTSQSIPGAVLESLNLLLELKQLAFEVGHPVRVVGGQQGVHDRARLIEHLDARAVGGVDT